MNENNKDRLTGVVTMEDDHNLEIEIDDNTHKPKLLLFPRLAYPHLRGGDVVKIHLEKISESTTEKEGM